MSKHANLRLTAKLLPIIAPFIAKNDIRYYLNAINVRPHKDGGAIICATNGHALGAIHDRDAVCEHEVILRFDARMQQACAGGPKDKRAVVMIGDRLAVVDEGGTDVYIQAGRPDVEATFPNYARVIPRMEELRPGLVGMFGANLITLCEKAAAAAAKSSGKKLQHDTAMQFFSVKGDPNLSAVVRLWAAPEFIGVLMPMRAEGPMAVMPSWALSLPPVDDLAIMTKAAAARSVADEVPA